MKEQNSRLFLGLNILQDRVDREVYITFCVLQLAL